MTHFPVIVCLDDPSGLEAVLAPFDENLHAPCQDCQDGRECADESCGVNPRAKWDWWVTGGRWGGYFRFRPEHASLVIPHEKQWSSPDVEPGYCDGGPKLALDLDGMRAEAAAQARERYAQWAKLTAGTPEALPWSVFTQNISEVNGYTIEQARTEYHSQPRVQAIKDTDFDWFASDAIAELQVPEQVYVERARASAVPGWAVVTTDGRWMEQGRMGWWTMSDATEGSKIGFWEAANAYIESLPDTTFLICIDCHILLGGKECATLSPSHARTPCSPRASTPGTSGRSRRTPSGTAAVTCASPRVTRGTARGTTKSTPRSTAG
jgi:hypothetical protein